MAKFRYSLKAEVGLFFPMMLLRAIEPAAVGTKPNMAGAGPQSALCSVIRHSPLSCQPVCQATSLVHVAEQLNSLARARSAQALSVCNGT